MISKLRGSHPEYTLTSPFLLKTIHTGQQGRASGYCLGLPLSLMSPARGTQAALFLKYAKCPPTPSSHTGLSFALTALLLESLTRFLPRPWSGSLLKVTSERPSLPSLLPKTTAPLTHPLFHSACFIFLHITAWHCTYFSLCLSPPTITQAPRAWRQSDFAHFWVISNYNSRDSACVA